MNNLIYKMDNVTATTLLQFLDRVQVTGVQEAEAFFKIITIIKNPQVVPSENGEPNTE